MIVTCMENHIYQFGNKTRIQSQIITHNCQGWGSVTPGTTQAPLKKSNNFNAKKYVVGSLELNFKKPDFMQEEPV